MCSVYFHVLDIGGPIDFGCIEHQNCFEILQDK